MMLKSNQYLGHLKIDAHANNYLIGYLCFVSDFFSFNSKGIFGIS